MSLDYGLDTMTTTNFISSRPKHILRKHAYSNILKSLQPKKETFQIKNSDIFHTSAQKVNCGYSLEPPLRSGSNEFPQSMLF